MIYPILAYGNSILRKKDIPVEMGTDVKTIIANMFETTSNANGIGLACPQIGMNLRMFIVDTSLIEGIENLHLTFINPEIKMEGEDVSYEEGCLSLPGINEDIIRKEKVTISYYDKNWVKHQEEFDGIIARIIQHEYDHIEGILFTDKLSGFKKRLLKGKLNDIKKGNVSVKYKMKFI